MLAHPLPQLSRGYIRVSQSFFSHSVISQKRQVQSEIAIVTPPPPHQPHQPLPTPPTELCTDVFMLTHIAREAKFLKYIKSARLPNNSAAEEVFFF